MPGELGPPGGPRPALPGSARTLAGVALIVVVGCLCWGRGITTYFDLDDFILLEGSLSSFERSSSLGEWLGSVFLAEGIIDHNYRPVSTHLVFLPMQKLFGTSPWAFHAFGLLLHVGAAVLVFVLALQLGGSHPGAMIAALFYVSRDALYCAVGWCAGVQDGLMATLSLVSITALVLAGRRRSFRRLLIALSLLSMLGAFLSKESSYVLPALATAFAWGVSPRRGGRRWLDALRRTAPHWVLFFLFAGFRAGVVGLEMEQYPLSLNLASLWRPGIYAFWNLAGVGSARDEVATVYRALAGLGWIVLAAWAWFVWRAARRGTPRSAPLVTVGLLGWAAGVAFLTVQSWRFNMYYLSLPAACSAIALAGALDALADRSSSARTARWAGAVVALVLVVSGATLIELKNQGRVDTGGYYLPKRAPQNLEIYEYVKTNRPGLRGTRRVIFMEWVDRGVVGSDPDGTGYRGESPIASMLRHHFRRPDLEVFYSFPPDSPFLRYSIDHDYLRDHVVSHEQIIPSGARPDDLIIRMRI